MTNAYVVQPGEWTPKTGDIAVTLDLLINGGLALPDPYGPQRDVFEIGGKRYRPVRWDLEAMALICWQVP